MIKFVLETIMQHAHSASSVLSHINLTNLSWQSNAGHVIEAALRSLRLDWSRFGKRVWRVEAPGEAIEWRERAAKNTLRPAPQRASTIGELDDSELQHDTAAEGVAPPITASLHGKVAIFTPLSSLNGHPYLRKLNGFGCGAPPGLQIR